MSVSRKEVKKWMRMNHADYENETCLAENAACEFDISSALDDETHRLWEEAFLTFEWADR